MLEHDSESGENLCLAFVVVTKMSVSVNSPLTRSLTATLGLLGILRKNKGVIPLQMFKNIMNFNEF